MRSYYCVSTILNTDHEFEIMTEEEYFAINGSERARPYVGKVYRGEISIDYVPDYLREDVNSAVNARIERWGRYEDRHISSEEAIDIIVGGNQ